MQFSVYFVVPVVLGLQSKSGVFCQNIPSWSDNVITGLVHC